MEIFFEKMSEQDKEFSDKQDGKNINGLLHIPCHRCKEYTRNVGHTCRTSDHKPVGFCALCDDCLDYVIEELGKDGEDD